MLAVAWALIVIRSFQVVRPAGSADRDAGHVGRLVVIMALMVCTPLVYAANATYVLRDTLSSIFSGDKGGAEVNASNPWKNRPRVNILLLGGDGGKDRRGIRTDSMTVASIDTKTGNTVLLSLPRQPAEVPGAAEAAVASGPTATPATPDRPAPRRRVPAQRAVHPG